MLDLSPESFMLGVWDSFVALRERELDENIRCTYTRGAIGDEHHGCPFPLFPDDDSQTALHWQEQPRLWCYPADYSERKLSVPIEGVSEFPCACMGTMFWFVYYSLKSNGLEYEISNSQLMQFQLQTLKDSVEGLGRAAIRLGLCTHFHQDITKAKPGNLLIVRRLQEEATSEPIVSHHWCVVFPDVRQYALLGDTPSTDSVVVTDEGVWTLGASPHAKGGRGGVGSEVYKFKVDRDFIVVPVGE